MIKKVITVLGLFIIGVILVSCKNKQPNLVISKLYIQTSMTQNIIELYNNSSEEIDLTSYKINLYSSGKKTPIESESFSLTGVIKPNSFYIIIGQDTHIDKKADLILESYMFFSGLDALALVNQDNVVDIIGTIGITGTFPDNRALIRLGNSEDFKNETTYNEFNYIAYIPTCFEYVGNFDYEIKTKEDLLDGPRLEERYLSLPYELNDNGGGGAISVTLISIADGDTATFYAPEFLGNQSNRYYYINTPEVQGSNVDAEPWGYVASHFNKQYILKNGNSNTLYVQSVYKQALTETYSRKLSLVWINGQLSQFLTVREGLSEEIQRTYSESDHYMTYLNVPYLTFLRYAEYNARINGWGVFGYPVNPKGEVAPDWNYNTNKSYQTLKTEWTPHYSIVW